MNDLVPCGRAEWVVRSFKIIFKINQTQPLPGHLL